MPTEDNVFGPFGNFNIFGIVAQGGVYITPKLEAFARWEYGRYERDVDIFGDLQILTAGLNYYIDGHDLKWTNDIGVGINPVDANWLQDIAGYRWDLDKGQIVFRSQFQLLF